MAVFSIRLQVLQGKDFCQFYLPLYSTLVPGKEQILNKRSRKEPSYLSDSSLHQCIYFSKIVKQVLLYYFTEK